VLQLVGFSCSPSKDSSFVLNPGAFKAKIENDNVQLIDVRTSEEYNKGHIKGAKNIDYFSDSFGVSIGLLDKKYPIFIYCKSGKRSSRSAASFKAVGFDSIYQLKGGYLNWKDHNLD